MFIEESLSKHLLRSLPFSFTMSLLRMSLFTIVEPKEQEIAMNALLRSLDLTAIKSVWMNPGILSTPVFSFCAVVSETPRS